MKKIAAVIILVAVIASVGFGAWYLANSPVPYSSAPEAITIGTTPTMSASLIFIAEEQGWFTQNGLRVTVKTFETTLPAIAEMKKGGVDVATTTEYTIVTEVLKKESIVLIAGIDRQQTTYLVARKDRGIEKVSDLKGKKVGVVRGTIQEFYLGRFLDLGGIRLQDLVLIDLKLPEQVDALVNGSVDAVQIPNVSINQVEERLGNRATVWPSKPDQVAHIVMASTADWTARHPEAIKRLMKALVQAEEYFARNPADAKAIVQKRLNYADTYIAPLWPEHQFALSLDQSLVIAMKDEAQWMIDNDLTTETQRPDFLPYIYLDGLKAVKPAAVTIFAPK